MFGLLVGTLNKVKMEDKERNATDAVRPSLSTFCLSWSSKFFILRRDQCSGKSTEIPDHIGMADQTLRQN
jgi:hypothetical protein